MIRRVDGVFWLFSLPGMAALAFSAIIWVFLSSGAVSLDTAEAASRRASVGSTQNTRMKGPKTEKKDPIHVNSDRMEAYNKKNMIVFIGNVVAVQGAMQIQSDRMEVYMKSKEKTGGKGNSPTASKPRKTSPGTPSGAPGQGSVERLIAIGNVLVNQGKEKYASGDHLDYRETTGIAILTGNPRAWENNNQVIGTKIELFLRDGRTVVHGSRSRRVSVTLYPESQPGNSPKPSRKGSNGR